MGIKAPPEDSWQYKFFMFSTHPRFEWFIIICILINTLLMGCRWFGQPYELTLTMLVLNYVFSAVFFIEMVIKLLGFGCSYFKDAWNIFDFTIVWLAVIGTVVSQVSSVSVGPVASAVRAFRIGRLIRLVRNAKNLRELVNTIFLTLPAVANISAVLFLLYFIYAVMGVQLFAKVKFGESLNSHGNFMNFGSAMMMLFRSATGENWNGVMYDLANTEDCRTGEVTYNDTMCGFSGDETNCIPLDGCG